VSSTPAAIWRDRIRDALQLAMKQRDQALVKTLRSALSAIDNAEAAPPPGGAAPDDGPIAGATHGVGTTEVERRALTDEEVRQVLVAEATERREAAAELEALGRQELATDLRTGAELLDRLLL
jgi:uncharacterized protein